MRKIKWGVLGTAYIFERDTARGMALAENCELVAIAGRTLEKALAYADMANLYAKDGVIRVVEVKH